MAEATADISNEPILEDDSAEKRSTRKKWLTRLAIVVGLLLLIYGAWYFLVGKNYVSTDNAYVNADLAQVTPLISAQVIELSVQDTQAVKRGDILVKLDPTNAQIAVAQAEADLAEAQRKFEQTVARNGALSAQVNAAGADIVQAQASVASAQAEFEKARVDLQRRERLAPEGAVSGDELTSTRKAYAAAKAALDLARAGVLQAESSRAAATGELQSNDALVKGSTKLTDPAVQAAQARLEMARLDLDRTVIRAPIDGVVAKRQVQIGQRVAQGSPIMTIIPLSQVYIDANFKERQLRDVKVGMPATIVSDLYGSGVVYHGKVIGFSGGTGASMALIPAQNATGNWIKVVQRLPVRIALDPKELAAHPLQIGLSTEVEIDISGK